MTATVRVVVERDGGVLAVSRSGALRLPEGKVAPGVAPETAAALGLREETGLIVSPSTLFPVCTEIEYDRAVIAYFAPDPGQPLTPTTGEGIAVWTSWPALIEGPFGSYNARVRAALPETVPTCWISTFGSGSLRRAREEGMAWREMYLHERAAFEIGYGFAPVAPSRITQGRALAEGDSPAVTETCWWARALRWRAARAGRADTFEVIHATVSDGDGGSESGLAILCTPSPRLGWLPSDRVLVALTVGKDGRPVNPC